MKKGDDLITVIIPIYNVKQYLEECVQSVLKQTYGNLEVILIDDGSTDGSGELGEELKKRDKRITLIHKENEGLGFARNSGLDIATGKFITFLDSDDYIESTMIEKLYNGMKANDVDECKMGFQYVKNDKRVNGEKKYEFELFLGDEARTRYAPRLIGSSPQKHDSIEMCVCGTLFDSSLIQKYNLRFPSERELISEDLIFQLEYLQYANGACTIEGTEYKYRVNDASLTRSYRADRKEKSIFFYEEVVRKLKTYGYGTDVINRAKKSLFVYVRMSISQEVAYEKNSMRGAIKNIKEICSDQRIQNVIESYPRKKLGMAQKIFLGCIRYRMGFALYCLKKIRVY